MKMKLIFVALLCVPMLSVQAQKISGKKERSAKSSKAEKEIFKVVKEAFVYNPIQGTTVTAGYGSIQNTSKAEQELQIVQAAGFKVVEMHETVLKDGMMKMQKINSVKLKPNEIFEMKAGGNHIMLYEPEKKFKAGELVTVTFKSPSQSFNFDFKIKDRESVDTKKKSSQEDHSHHH